jgi:hypothetical protein
MEEGSGVEELPAVPIVMLWMERKSKESSRKPMSLGACVGKFEQQFAASLPPSALYNKWR